MAELEKWYYETSQRRVHMTMAIAHLESLLEFWSPGSPEAENRDYDLLSDRITEFVQWLKEESPLA